MKKKQKHIVDAKKMVEFVLKPTQRLIFYLTLKNNLKNLAPS